MSMPADPFAVVRTKRYSTLLVLAAILGVPISAFAYLFLTFVSHLQNWVFTSLPEGLGFKSEPVWWPLLPLFVAGILVGAFIQYLPGRGGHSPADGFKAGGAPSAIELPGVFLAALATLALGVVLGPEAPLIALGGGLAALVVETAKRDAPEQTMLVLAAAGSFAAISTLLGSPLLGAFLLLEATGLGGPVQIIVLLPGLLAAGIGYLIFIGFDSITGLGTQSLVIPQLPAIGRPNGAEFLWAIGIGLAAVVVGTVIRRLGLALRSLVERRLIAFTPVIGLTVAGLAILYYEVTGKATSDVLFSGQSALPALLQKSATFSAGALVMLVLCKGLAYGASLSSFRGGPIFPAMFVGAAGGLALAHLPGLQPDAGAAMGIGAMSAVMLRLPVTSVLLATLLLASTGLDALPLVIVAVVVAFVVSSWTIPSAAPAAPAPAPAQAGATEATSPTGGEARAHAGAE
jgi:H+/Cl- antiporter ClcA